MSSLEEIQAEMIQVYEAYIKNLEIAYEESLKSYTRLYEAIYGKEKNL